MWLKAYLDQGVYLVGSEVDAVEVEVGQDR